MLPSKQRISKTEFKALGRSVSYHSPLISLFIYKKSDQSPSQFSFLCSKKISKSAVKRNTLRRRGYSIIGKAVGSIKTGFYFVFSFKKGAEKSTFKEIEADILFLLKKSGMMG